MPEGYIKLWRKSLDSPVWDNPKVWRFWTWCLMKASHKDYKTTIGFQEIALEKGQFIFGRLQASKETKLSEQSVRTCLFICTAIQTVKQVLDILNTWVYTIGNMNDYEKG